MCLYVCVCIHKFLYLFVLLVIWLKSIIMFHKSFLSNHLSVLIRKQPPETLRQGVFWGISRGSLGGACAGVSIFNRVGGLRPVTLLIGRLRRGYFPVGFVGFLGGPFLGAPPDDCFC